MSQAIWQALGAQRIDLQFSKEDSKGLACGTAWCVTMRATRLLVVGINAVQLCGYSIK